MTTIIATFIMTHLTLICVTLYLHRCQAHRGIVLHPVVSHFMRFWLWLTTGMRTQEWVAIHRKHHGHTDRAGDPHSPMIYGIWRVLFGGAFLYADAANDNNMVDTWGRGTPNDWIELKLYSAHPSLGICILFLLDYILFDWWGVLVWAVQMINVPFLAAGVINGLAHWWGYRNGNTSCNSHNIVPWGIIIVGEELHHNHHLDTANPCFRHKWWEIDLGWVYFKILEHFDLAYLRQPT